MRKRGKVILTNGWVTLGDLITGGEKKTINSELWHACAGPLVNLPAAGTHVVYFPQGHSEQVSLFLPQCLFILPGNLLFLFSVFSAVVYLLRQGCWV